MSENEWGISLGRLGNLEVRLARSDDEIADAQRLRYRVFYEEMSAVADSGMSSAGRDRDAYDRAADHLIVVDHAAKARRAPTVVATSRLLRNEAAKDGFYSASEFDIADLVARNPERRFLELGRLCILQPYRSTRAGELMWHGLWRYARSHQRDVMFGCGSIEGTDVARLAPLLALLRRKAPAPDGWRVKARAGRGIPLDDIVHDEAADEDTLRAVPPFLRGYLRLGAYVCEEAVVDHQFGTTDVFLVLPEEAISTRYARFVGREGDRAAA